MPTTREQCKKDYDHVLSTVLGCDDDHPITKSFLKQGFADPTDITGLSDPYIEALTYDKSDQEQDVPLTLHHKGTVCMFRFYWFHHSQSDNPVGDKWSQITNQMFRDFCATPEAIHYTMGNLPPPQQQSYTSRYTKLEKYK